MKVLVIDDSPDQRASVGLLLKAIGHDAVTAPDGTTGLAMAALFLPDVVLLDFEMPDMNGYEVTRRLRRVRPLRGARIVLLTGSARVTEDDARVAGCDALMYKPSPLSAILAALHGARSSKVFELREPLPAAANDCTVITATGSATS